LETSLLKPASTMANDECNRANAGRRVTACRYCSDVDGGIVEFRIVRRDYLAIAFSTSPGYEMCGAIRVLQDVDRYPEHAAWSALVRESVPAGAFELMRWVVGADGHVPAFLAATGGWFPTPADEVDRVRDLSAEVVRAGLARVVESSAGRRRDTVRSMLDNRDRTPRAIADAWEELWAAILTPYWARIQRLLRADIAGRPRHDTGRLIDGLHDSVGWALVDWREECVRVRSGQPDQPDEIVEPAPTGLVLAPSVMFRTCTVRTDEPTLFYPARGVTPTWPTDGATG
jgi:hypothetical protein